MAARCIIETGSSLELCTWFNLSNTVYRPFGIKMISEFIDKIYLKYKLKNVERMFLLRTIASTRGQLFEAPFDPSLVYPSPFVIGYINGQSDKCLEISSYNQGF